jgi:hypothetical protein
MKQYSTSKSEYIAIGPSSVNQIENKNPNKISSFVIKLIKFPN